MAAASKVFATTELLEAILLSLGELSINDLWKAQHINKRACAVIRGSHKLATRFFSVLFPSGDIPPPGSDFTFFDNVLFDAHLTSQRQSHRWRRKLHLPQRKTDKPEGKLSRFISKCFNAASFLRHIHSKSTLFVLLSNRTSAMAPHWLSPWTSRFDPAKFTKVEVCWIQQVPLLRVSNGWVWSVDVKVSASVQVRQGCTLFQLARVMKHIVAAHPFDGKLVEDMWRGNWEDPVVVKWSWSGYSKAPGMARQTADARENMVGEPTYCMEMPAKMGWRWRVMRALANIP